MVRSYSSDLPASHGVIGVRFGIGDFYCICFNDNIINLEGIGNFLMFFSLQSVVLDGDLVSLMAIVSQLTGLLERVATNSARFGLSLNPSANILWTAN